MKAYVDISIQEELKMKLDYWAGGMTSAELRQFLVDMPVTTSHYHGLTPTEVLLAHCLVSIVDGLEQIREEMITRMPVIPVEEEHV